MLKVKQEAVNTNFKVIALTQLAIKPESTAPCADALTTRPSEQISFNSKWGQILNFLVLAHVMNVLVK